MKVRWLVAVLIIGLFGTAYAQKTHKPLKLPSGKKGMQIKAEGGAAVGYYFWEDGTGSNYWLDETNTSYWTNTTILTGADDDTFSLTATNNFNFKYFGTTYNFRKSRVWINSNGFLTLGINPGDPANSYSADMPNENDPNNTVAAFWTDLELKDASGANTSIYYADSTGANTQKMIFYFPVRYVNDSSYLYYFQTWLIEGDTVVFSYKNDAASDYTVPSNKELGVENSDGSISIEFDASNIKAAFDNGASYYWIKFYYRDTYVQSFESAALPDAWSTGTGSGTWSFGNTDHARLGNASAMFNSSTFSGNGVPLITPRIDLSYAGSPYFIFYLYHDESNAGNPDSLYIDVSYDGGLSWSTLAGYPRYAPYNGWEKIRVNLEAYIGYSNVKVRFRPVAYGGGNIYIDAVKIFTDYNYDIDADYTYYPEYHLLPITAGDSPDSLRLKVKNLADSINASVYWGYYVSGTGWTDASIITDRVFLGGAELDTVLEIFTATPSNIESLHVYVVYSGDQEPLGDTISWAVTTSEWASWDDGTPEDTVGYSKIAVKFKNPYAATNIDSIGIYVASATKGTFDSIYVAVDSSGVPGPILSVKTGVSTPAVVPGWLWVELDSVVNDNMHYLWVVAVQSGGIAVGTDRSHPNGFSAYYDPVNGWTDVSNQDYMMRLRIHKKPAHDAKPISISIDKYADSHVSTAYSSDYTIKPVVVIQNVGSDTLDSVKVNFQISQDGGTTWDTISTENIGVSLIPGASYTYRFSNGYNALSDADGTNYNVRVVVDSVYYSGAWAKDDDPSNDVLDAEQVVVKDTVHARESSSGWKWEDNVGDVYADISADTTWWDYVTSGADDTLALGDYGTVRVALPFAVNFFGVNYDSVYIGANGAIDFVSSDIPNDNVDLSTYNATGKALVAAFWEDLETKASVYSPPDQLIYLKSSADGTLPDTFAITWYNVQIASTSESVTFQILIIDNAGTYTDFLFHYKDPFTFTSDSVDPTVGLYNNVGSGTYYAQYSYDDDPLSLSSTGNVWLTAPKAIYWDNPTPTEVEEGDRNGLPKTFALAPVKPNPVSGMANISFALPKDARVRIEVYDATGRVVETIANDRFSAGYHTVTWNAGHTTNGVYFIRMKADGFNQTRRVIVMK